MGTHSDTLRSIVAETTAKIHHYQSLLQKLLAKRDSAQLELDSLAYPILTLPPEITSEIFLHSLPTSYGDCERNAANPREAPMLLCYVCRTWREIALSTPALWTTIDLHISDIECAEIFQAWLDRAGAFPLFVKLKISGDLEDDVVGGIFKTLASRSRTVQSLELRASVEHLRYMEDADEHWSFPLLQMLCISSWDAEDADEEDLIKTFTNFPLLREASLSQTPPSLIPLPWHQLIKLTAAFDTLADCLEVLRLSPNLAEYSFTLTDDDAFADLTALIHSNLQSLSLLENASIMFAGITGILDYLSLPALQTLHIVDSESDESNWQEILEGFLTRSSSPPLRKFAVHLPSTDFEPAMFLNMPYLVDLQIWNPSRSFIEDFCDSFIVRDPRFLPQLQHLAFLGCESPPPAYDMLDIAYSGLAERWRARHDTGFAELKSFRLVWARDFGSLHEDALSPFQELVAEGMDIHIQGQSISYI
ncbi:hypothetical protein B0H17DRAFT_1199503 [Mycena rosella]|uniref:F-box domain-containing protein n=1 Tax=Mycena rosella TaxID=1033263 RepID=A0AAD7DL38_MYCRO|nr:hypothetical protein B0H17DRAFT_1199503 [Mycena rosella]